MTVPLAADSELPVYPDLHSKRRCDLMSIVTAPIWMHAKYLWLTIAGSMRVVAVLLSEWERLCALGDDFCLLPLSPPAFRASSAERLSSTPGD